MALERQVLSPAEIRKYREVHFEPVDGISRLIHGIRLVRYGEVMELLPELKELIAIHQNQLNQKEQTEVKAFAEWLRLRRLPAVQ